jgi:hypothetical protein
MGRRHAGKQAAVPRAPALLGTVAGLAMSVAAVAGLEAQVIQNYEVLDRDAPAGPYLRAAASFEGRVGNERFLDAEVAGALGWRGASHWVRLFPSLDIRETRGSVTSRDLAVQLRHSYWIREGLRTFAFLQAQRNDALELRLRALAGGGLRLRVVDLVGGGIDVGVGAMLEREESGGPTSEADTDVRGANLVSAWGGLGDGQLSLVAYIQPRLDAWSDVRIATTGTLTHPLTDALDLSLTLFWRRDSRPPDSVEPDDAGLRVGFRLTVPAAAS